MLKLNKPEEFIGSPCKYYTFRLFTLIQLLIGLGTMILGILVSINISSLPWHSIVYIITGLILLILAFFSHSTYSSTKKLISFLTILFLCFCSELGVLIAIYLQQLYVPIFGSLNSELAEYILLGACFTLFLEFVFGSWYLSSVRDAEIEKENFKLLTKN